MSDIRILLEDFWINRATDKALYNKTKREAVQYRKFFNEQLGWKLISNERILKLEKVPAKAESFMGVEEFSDVRDYCILCAILMFLEDKEDNEQFLLSELIDTIEVKLAPHMEVDWTKFVQRKSLVRALQFAEGKGMMAVFEGRSEAISSSIEHEVLYENTGLSRYFAITFDYDIKHFKSYRDFEARQAYEGEADKGHYRINRVYRQLVAAPAMYWAKNDDPDSVYLRNQRPWVQKYMEENLGGYLQIHKNAAFFIVSEEDSFGDVHPKNSMISELVLLLCSELHERVCRGVYEKNMSETVFMTDVDFSELVTACRQKYGKGFSKEYREMDGEKVCEAVKAYMKNWMMLFEEEDGLVFYAGAGKTIGAYPKDYQLKEKKQDEQ